MYYSITETCETNMFADDTEIDTAEKPVFSTNVKLISPMHMNDLNELKEYM